MARIILSELLNDIRASMGSHVYSVWKGVHYIREKAQQVFNPNSYYQEIRRWVVENYSKRWFSTLTDAQRNAWNEFAQTIGSAIKSDQSQGRGNLIPSNRKVMSGYNAYILVNGLARSIGIAADVDDAPLGIDGPSQVFDVEVVYAAGPPQKFTLNWADPVDMPDGAKIRIWGRSRKYAHLQLIATVAKGTQTADVTAMRGAGGASIGLPSDYYQFQIDCVTAVGLKSAGSKVVAYNKVA